MRFTKAELEFAGQQVANVCTKIAYVTSAHARTAARAADATRQGVKQNPYLCPHCGLWHLTNSRPKPKNRRTPQALRGSNHRASPGKAFIV